MYKQGPPFDNASSSPEHEMYCCQRIFCACPCSKNTHKGAFNVHTGALCAACRSQDNTLFVLCMTKQKFKQKWLRMFCGDPDGARCMQPIYTLTGQASCFLNACPVHKAAKTKTSPQVGMQTTNQQGQPAFNLFVLAPEVSGSSSYSSQLCCQQSSPTKQYSGQMGFYMQLQSPW